MISRELLKSETVSDTIEQMYRAPVCAFLPVVVGGKLAFKFDPARGLIEWQDRGVKHIIDLATVAKTR